MAEGAPGAILRQVAVPPVIHLRTQEASEVLLRWVDRAGEGMMVSPTQGAYSYLNKKKEGD